MLSLFSGAGGLDIGFHDAGCQIVECNELEGAFAATLVENSRPGGRLSGTDVVCADIRDYNPTYGDIDFIVGGPPCQTFSAAGARAAGVNGTDDERGNLFREYVRILQELKPQGFLFENVYRIIGAQGGRPWAEIQEAFRAAGYKLFWRILDTADYGVPQFRERVIIVGLRDGEYRFPVPSHGPDSPDGRPYYTAAAALRGLRSKVSGVTLGGRHGHLLHGIPPGLNYSFYTERMGHPRPIFGWRSKFSDYLYKADPDTPVRTIKAQGGQYTGPFHWNSRTFTIEELKRLQTFPDTYTIVGKRQKVIHQLGNSVPPQLARVLATSILQQVFSRRLPFPARTLAPSYRLGFRARKSALTKVYAKKAADAIANLDASVGGAIEAKGTAFGSLKEGLRLSLTTADEDSDFSFDHAISGRWWSVTIRDTKVKRRLKYEISILPRSVVTSDSGVASVEMKSFSDDPRSVLCLWKYFETIVKAHAHKDDLVQLFGYYQYKQSHSIVMNLKARKLSADNVWTLLVKVANGHGVGRLIHLGDLALEYGMDEVELLDGIRSLKELGYEIRSHNTNRQIGPGMILIPYAFPSLNERSLQRLTVL